MRQNPVRIALRNRQMAHGIMATEFLTPGLCQILANAGAEYVIFDMEHGGMGIDAIKAQCAFARNVGVVPLVRVTGHHYHLIAPILDAGAMGIMEPMVETRAQAEELAAWCRYRPEGRRGVGFGYAHDDYKGQDVIAGMKAENDRVMVIPLIETAKGIENVEAIMAVPGVDLGWFGHYDLSDSLGITAQFDHPMFQAALTRFLKACEVAGKPAGVLGAGMEMVRGWRTKGFRCLCYGSDVSVFQSALKGALDTLKGEAG